jgi:hypothetical protein
MASSPIPARFAGIELDLSTGELRRNGALLKLQPQPARNLTILVSRVGEVVRRQELAREVWGSNKLNEHGKLCSCCRVQIDPEPLDFAVEWTRNNAAQVSLDERT